jgi:hypothetical protein
LNRQRDTLNDLGVDLKYFFWSLGKGNEGQTIWTKVNWADEIPVADLDDDDFLIFKQDGVLTHFDVIAPFDMD